MKKINFKEQAFIVHSAGVVLILLVYSLFFLRPTFSSFHNLNAQISKLKSELQRAKADIANIENLRKQSNSMKEKMDYVRLKFPKEAEVPSLLETLSTIAKESQVKIVEIKPEKETTLKEATAKSKSKLSPSAEGLGKFYSEIPILINANCGYHQLGTFINRLENAGRFMKITDIQIEGNASSPKSHDVKLLVSIFVLTGE